MTSLNYHGSLQNKRVIIVDGHLTGHFLARSPTGTHPSIHPASLLSSYKQRFNVANAEYDAKEKLERFV
ncbi:hypothetical protein GALMADRAFT_232134 [Galerina marginata CBS 339.88]|uniref:Uncharacterized protein n=1 Tax=Galerina marginata (strain CBS 339.88) TaxID=685588 RepID=A0A067SHR9_GALM3|nr:hypothetical protein GALMADRAFT_232134 [Galerina marginata CBS 339.88]